MLALPYVAVCVYSETLCHLFFFHQTRTHLCFGHANTLNNRRRVGTNISALCSILPQLPLGFNIHKFPQPTSFFAPFHSSSSSVTPRVLPVADGPFDTNKSFRRDFPMNRCLLQRSVTNVTSAMISRATSSGNNIHNDIISARIKAFLCMEPFGTGAMHKNAVMPGVQSRHGYIKPASVYFATAVISL